MDLILWRHAEAEDGIPDIKRQLTEKGEHQAHLMANWLTPRLPKNLRILVSPAVRTRQTADALKRDYTIINDIAPGATPEELLTAAEWPMAEDSVLLVGHQPTLGLVASLLLQGKENSLDVKKGAILWFISQETGFGLLHAALSPKMLKD